MDPRTTIHEFDEFLADRGLTLDAVIVSGTALGLLGVVTRPTRDCDVLRPAIPGPVREAAEAFAAERRAAGEVLNDDWLNEGPASLAADLPGGWELRLQMAYDGTAVRLRTLGRTDLLLSKLYALCDRALDLPDCVALRPSARELADILPWLVERDANPDWPAHVRATLANLAERLGHGL